MGYNASPGSTVTGAVTVSGTAATDLGKAEDAAHATGDVGVMSLAVRTATPANRSGTDGDYEPLQVSAGRLWTSAAIDTALPAGTAIIGSVRPAAANSTANAPTVARVQSAATTNATSTKGSAGVLNQWAFGNNGVGPAYVKFYNKASAPNVGVDTPVFVIYLPATSTVQHAPDAGIPFATGIAYAITGAATDGDTTAVAADQVIGYFGYV
jgi:hypothetical protein